MTVQIGQQVPDFSASMTSGKTFKLSDYSGKRLVLFFYPKDSTPGCTTESIDFTCLYPQFQALGIEVFGVSKDGVSPKEKFKAKHEMPFELIADETTEICQLFDLYKEKNMYGKKYMGIERSTFIIDENGVLTHEWRKVKVPNHAQEVLEVCKSV